MPMLELPGETVFSIEAISPTTGAAITSVSVSDIVIYGIPLGGAVLDLDVVPVLSAEALDALTD